MHVVFDNSVHLRCILHFKHNLDMKLREYGVPKNVRDEFFRDIFGSPQDLETGLVNAESEQDLKCYLRV